ncbi:hypothetical protein ADL12_04285 [Streptomyces regalis]|uniref:Uncharacterized protein n=1 Tax=Streptomyces regalis TaxID=68262 RepID=A0A0X3VJV7_9ACTN|nr:hypothetical protein ADL12_04285 [Streptomyces regalis]
MACGSQAVQGPAHLPEGPPVDRRVQDRDRRGVDVVRTQAVQRRHGADSQGGAGHLGERRSGHGMV